MDKEVLDSITNLRRLVRVLFPSVVKKHYIESSQNLFNEYLDELDNKLKEYLTN